MIFLFIFLLCFSFSAIQAEEEITVDLRAPVYCQGVITTDQGGIITGPNLRIQAMHIIYTRKLDAEPPIYTIVAEGNLMLEFGDYIFVGERLEYDFHTKTGVIYQGKTMSEPWFFGGDYVELRSDGSYLIYNAFVTTSEQCPMDWYIAADRAELSCDSLLEAENIKLRILNIPVFWLPSFKMNLNSIFDSPVRYSVKWGSRQGHRFGLIYELFSWNRWKAFLRLDYRLKRGLGGGIETHYRSLDHKICLETINYVARDSSLIHPGQRLRYRFQGVGDALLLDDKVSIHLSYDKISDIDMPTDYNDRGIELDTAGRTELLIRRQEEQWIANFVTRVRINNFQTIKQELPTFETSWRPFNLGDTQVVSDMQLKAAYLNFAYGNNQIHVHDYCSSRLEFTPSFYRHFSLGNINIMPEIGGVVIAYGNSPHQKEAKLLALGQLCCTLNTQLYRSYSCFKHQITPYVQYSYFTYPTVSPDEHYIFDIDDGWYRLSMMRFGIEQNLFGKDSNGYPYRYLYVDLYANAFFNTHTFSQAIPKAYFNVIFNTFSFLRHSLFSGWDFIHNEVDHYNIRTEWTVNANIAFAAEYRHRSAYDWRKADHTNFILDSFRSISQLRHSQLSDRRDTLLLHFFYRFHPDWAFEFESRHGWNRQFEPSYNEFEIDLLGTLRSAWNVKVSYQHRENDDRISFYFSIGIKRPNCCEPCNPIPLLGF